MDLLCWGTLENIFLFYNLGVFNLNYFTWSLVQIYIRYSITKVPTTLTPDPRRKKNKKEGNQDPKVEEKDHTEVRPKRPVLIQSTRSPDSSRETPIHSK